MAVVVRKSSLEVVTPPEPVTTADDINLSSYDKYAMCIPVTMFLVFDRSIQEPAAEAIKTALSKALVHYLPMSGRLAAARPGQDELIRVTRIGEGVSFVAAAANCALEDVVESFHQLAADELAVHYPAEICGPSDPLLMMQVTEFSCGGFVVGVTWNHGIVDASGIGQFLRAVGELARGLPSPSVVPARRGELLTGIPPPPSIGGLVELAMSVQPVEMPILDITVPSRIIESIKDDYSGGSRPACTTFEAVTALLWQCRTRAIALSNPEDTPVAIYITVNARKFVAARDGYYGNCVTGRLVVATGDAVANGRLTDVVEMIQRAKSQIAGQFSKGAAAQHIGSLAAYNIFVVTSWRNLGLEDVDFGGGRPVRVASYIPPRIRLPAVYLLPCRSTGDGSCSVLSACVTKDHARAFLGELSSSLK